MIAKRFMPLSAAAIAGVALFAGRADAAALYFEKVVVQTGSEGTCLSFAGTAARTQGLSNVHKTHGEVGGQRDGVYVAMTCVGRPGQPALAIVMSVADDFGVAQSVGHRLAGSIKGVECIDSPC